MKEAFLVVSLCEKSTGLIRSLVPLDLTLESMVLTEIKLKAGMNEAANNGRAEFLLLLRPDRRSLAYVSSPLPAASHLPPPPPPAATKPSLKL